MGNSLLKIMAPMKAMKAKAMKAASSSKALTKGALIKDIAVANELKTKEVSQIFDSLAAIATKEVKKTGVFTVPGLCRISRHKDVLRCRDEGEGKASKDNCESIPSFCTEEADLGSLSTR